MSALKALTLEKLRSQGRVDNKSLNDIELSIFPVKRDIIKEICIVYILYAIYEYSFLYSHNYIQTFLNYQSSVNRKMSSLTVGQVNAITGINEYFTQCLSALNPTGPQIKIEEHGSLVTAASSLLEGQFPKNIYSDRDRILEILCSLSSFLTINIHILLPNMQIRFGNSVSLSLYVKYSSEEFYMMYPYEYDEEMLLENFGRQSPCERLHCGHSIPDITQSQVRNLYESSQLFNNYTCICGEALYKEEKQGIQKALVGRFGKQNCAKCAAMVEEFTVKCSGCSAGYCGACAEQVVKDNKRKCFICERAIQYRIPQLTDTREMQRKPVGKYSGNKKECSQGCEIQKEFVYLCKCGNLKYNTEMLAESVCQLCKILPGSKNSQCNFCNSLLQQHSSIE